jgi:hypothetical protein
VPACPASVTGAGPPQAAETAAARSLQAGARHQQDPGQHVMGLLVHTFTYGYQPKGGYSVVSAHNANYERMNNWLVSAAHGRLRTSRRQLTSIRSAHASRPLQEQS